MLDRVFDMPLDYLSCFVVALKGHTETLDIYQSDYTIHSKL